MRTCSQCKDRFTADPLTAPYIDKQPPVQWNTAAVWLHVNQSQGAETGQESRKGEFK